MRYKENRLLFLNKGLNNNNTLDMRFKENKNRLNDTILKHSNLDN
jgi:hypothetical protein